MEMENDEALICGSQGTNGDLLLSTNEFLNDVCYTKTRIKKMPMLAGPNDFVQIIFSSDYLSYVALAATYIVGKYGDRLADRILKKPFDYIDGMIHTTSTDFISFYSGLMELTEEAKKSNNTLIYGIYVEEFFGSRNIGVALTDLELESKEFGENILTISLALTKLEPHIKNIVSEFKGTRIYITDKNPDCSGKLSFDGQSAFIRFKVKYKDQNRTNIHLRYDLEKDAVFYSKSASVDDEVRV